MKRVKKNTQRFGGGMQWNLHEIWKCQYKFAVFYYFSFIFLLQLEQIFIFTFRNTIIIIFRATIYFLSLRFRFMLAISIAIYFMLLRISIRNSEEKKSSRNSSHFSIKIIQNHVLLNSGQRWYKLRLNVIEDQQRRLWNNFLRTFQFFFFLEYASISSFVRLFGMRFAGTLVKFKKRKICFRVFFSTFVLDKGTAITFNT